MSGSNSAALPGPDQDICIATDELITSYGRQEAAARLVNRTQGRLSAYASTTTDEFAPLHVVFMLEDRTQGLPGHPHVTRALARRQGFGLVRLPSPVARQVQWSQFVGELGKEAGDLIGGICSDLASDNDMSPREARNRLKAAAKLVRVVVEIEAALQARSEEAE